MPTYQFIVKRFEAKKWTSEVYKVVECKNSEAAKAEARSICIREAADVLYRVAGSHKKHYYRPSERLKANIIERHKRVPSYFTE